MRIVTNNGHPELILEERFDLILFSNWCEKLEAIDGVSRGKTLEDIDALWCDFIYKEVRFVLHVHQWIGDVVLLPLDDHVSYHEAEALLKELAEKLIQNASIQNAE